MGVPGAVFGGRMTVSGNARSPRMFGLQATHDNGRPRPPGAPPPPKPHEYGTVGLYRFDGDKLTTVTLTGNGPAADAVPKDFTSTAPNGQAVWHWVRVRPARPTLLAPGVLPAAKPSAVAPAGGVR